MEKRGTLEDKSELRQRLRVGSSDRRRHYLRRWKSSSELEVPDNEIVTLL